MLLFLHVKKIAPNYPGGYSSEPRRISPSEWLEYLEFKFTGNVPIMDCLPHKTLVAALTEMLPYPYEHTYVSNFSYEGKYGLPKLNVMTGISKELNSDNKISAVGGPDISPKNQGFWQAITGLINNSFFISGFRSVS